MSAKLASCLNMSGLLLPLNSRSRSCKRSAPQYALPIAAQLGGLNVRGRPSHNTPHREPDNLGDDLEHQNSNTIVEPGIRSNSGNVD